MDDRDIKINTLEVNFKTMFDQNAIEHKDIKKSLEIMTEKFEQIILKMDEKYASKWVEKLLISIGAVIGLAFITYLTGIFYKATIFFK